MLIDETTIRRVATLARLRVEDGDIPRLQAELNGILDWMQQLRSVDTTGVEPLAGGGDAMLPLRADAVTDGGQAEAVLANAPDRAGDFFAVPKVVE